MYFAAGMPGIVNIVAGFIIMAGFIMAAGFIMLPYVAGFMTEPKVP